MRATISQKGASSGVASATRQRACDQVISPLSKASPMAGSRAMPWTTWASVWLARGEPEPLAGVVAQAGEAQVVVVAAAEEAVGERAEDPQGAGFLAGEAAEVAVERGGALGRPEPAAGVCREDVGGDDVRTHG